MKKYTKILIIFIMSCLTVITFSACSLQGKSAYEIAVENGYEGTVTEWLNSLNGTDGKDGVDGLNGLDGKDGKDGEDGKDAEPIVSLYQEAQNNGYTGTFYEFLTEYVKGDKGDKGESGTTAAEYAIQKAINSVVSIYAKFNVSNAIVANDTATSGGSGVIYKLDKTTGNAYIITNYHVVYYASATNATKISNDINVYIYGQEKEEYAIPATYIGGSLNYDIAVLKVEGSEVLKNSFAEQTEINEGYYVGDGVVAIGNPKAEGISATSGIVSVDSENIDMTGADNTTKVSFRVLRTDCAINEGNSGGGLFNMNGELIGIVNAKTISSNVENMGYAIPVTVAKSVAENILRNYNGEPVKVKKETFGITITIADSKAQYNSENGKVEIIQTIKISEVNDNSDAQKAGLQVDDVIVSYTYKGETKQITRLFQFAESTLNFEENSTITVKVLRNGEEVSVNVVAKTLKTIE